MAALFNPASYDRVSWVQEAWGRAVVEDALSRRGANPVPVLADLGCGTGRVTLYAAQAFRPRTVVCQDLSAEMVRVSVERLASQGFTAEPVVGDAAAFSAPRPCDLVLSTAAFHWVQDHDALAQHIRAALAPGGLLRAQAGGTHNLERTMAVAGRVFTAVTGRTATHYPARFSSDGEWNQRLTELGFSEVECWLRPEPTRFPDVAAFLDFTGSVVLLPFKTQLGDTPEAEFLARFGEAAQRELALTLDYVRVELAARKP